MNILSDEERNRIVLTEDELEECHQLSTIGVVPNDHDAYNGNFAWVTSEKLARKKAQAQHEYTLRQVVALMSFTVRIDGNKVIVDKYDWDNLWAELQQDKSFETSLRKDEQDMLVEHCLDAIRENPPSSYRHAIELIIPIIWEYTEKQVREELIGKLEKIERNSHGDFKKLGAKIAGFLMSQKVSKKIKLNLEASK